MTAPRERPILMSGPMVRAILAGRKTQTRRPVDMRHVGFIGGSGMQDDPSCWGFGDEDGCWHVLDQSCPAWHGADFGVTSESYRITSPFGSAGDRLWVRETWQCGWPAIPGTEYGLQLTEPKHATKIVYRASWDGEDQPPWRPSIHMPRRFSRLTLEVTGVRVERLQAISDEDIDAEGYRTLFGGGHFHRAFESLWDGIYGGQVRDCGGCTTARSPRRPGCTWSDNPWVWVVEFRRVEVAP